MSIRFRVKQTMKQAVQNVVLPVCYRKALKQAVDPDLVVFADAHHNSRPAAMELLYRRLKKDSKFRIVEHYLDYGSAGAVAVAKHSMRFMQLYASAGYVVICDNFLPVASCEKREETKVIQLWHACGCYKKFGYDAKDDIPPDYHGANVYRNADLVTVSSEAAVRPFASAMRLPEDHVQALGISRTDLYFRRKWQDRCREQFYERYPEAKGKKVILWAPTFRGNAGMPELDPLNLAALQRELGEEYLVLARLHPHMLKDPNHYEAQTVHLPGRIDLKHAAPDSDAAVHATSDAAVHATPDAAVHATSDAAPASGAKESSGAKRASLRSYLCEIPTEELYPVIDLLIADYSSLIYEYLLFQKPLILYVPDLEEYRARRGFYMAPEEIPARIVKKETELAKAVKASEAAKAAREAEAASATEAAEAAKAARASETETATASETEKLKSFLAAYMGACDGKATDRIVEWMVSCLP